MSERSDQNEARRWLDTAVDDLETVEVLRSAGKYAQACFHAQQSAEKAIKALCFWHGKDPWGHSIFKLIGQLENADFDIHIELGELKEPAKLLDRFYIPTRNPNGLPDITPSDAYDETDAQGAHSKAKTIVDGVATEVG